MYQISTGQSNQKDKSIIASADDLSLEQDTASSSLTRFWLVLLVLVGCMFVVTNASSQTIVYDSPGQNFITGITGLVITGTANDGTYDVSFEQGSFDAVFGVATMTADLTFQSDVDNELVSAQINTLLNGASPNGPVATSTNSGIGSDSITDTYMIPIGASATYSMRIGALITSTSQWIDGGNGSNQNRTALVAPLVCRTCLAKWAAFTLTGPVPSPVAIPMLSPLSLMLLVFMLAGGVFYRERVKERI